MRRVARVFGFAIVSLASRAVGQLIPSKDVRELVTPPIRIEESEVRSRCAPISNAERFSVAPRSSKCIVVAYELLGTAGGSSWAYAVYRHTNIYDFAGADSAARRDTIQEIESVLFAVQSGRPRRLTAALHAREDAEMLREITPSVASHGDVALVSLRFCVNGTGGCWQQFLARTKGLWQVVADPSSLIRAEIVRSLHGDTTQSVHMPNIDVRSLRGTVAVYGPADANCCPSQQGVFQLALDGGAFRIVRLRVEKPEGS
jgi:hypothetical protein